MYNTLQVGKSGLLGQQMLMDSIANNIANVNTTGFKKDVTEFSELMRQKVGDMGNPVVASGKIVPELSNGVKLTEMSKKSFGQGNLQQTGRSMDIAIDGDGFFGLQKNGLTCFTRDGSLFLNSDGKIVNAIGYQLSGISNLPKNVQEVKISNEGKVIAVNSEGKETECGEIKIYRFENPSGLKPIGENMFAQTGAEGTLVTGKPGQSGLGLLRQGYLELSNVDLAEEMTKMIEAQKAYSFSARSIQTADGMWGMANNIRKY